MTCEAYSFSVTGCVEPRVSRRILILCDWGSTLAQKGLFLRSRKETKAHKGSVREVAQIARCPELWASFLTWPHTPRPNMNKNSTGISRFISGNCMNSNNKWYFCVANAVLQTCLTTFILFTPVTVTGIHILANVQVINKLGQIPTRISVCVPVRTNFLSSLLNCKFSRAVGWTLQWAKCDVYCLKMSTITVLDLWLIWQREKENLRRGRRPMALAEIEMQNSNVTRRTQIIFSLTFWSYRVTFPWTQLKTFNSNSSSQAITLLHPWVCQILWICDKAGKWGKYSLYFFSLVRGKKGTKQTQKDTNCYHSSILQKFLTTEESSDFASITDQW